MDADSAMSLALGIEDVLSALTQSVSASPVTVKQAGEVASDLSDLDAAAEAWAVSVGWREQLEQLTAITRSVAGARLEGDGGADLKMMVLRQRNLFDRWVRQAFTEGLMARDMA